MEVCMCVCVCGAAPGGSANAFGWEYWLVCGSSVLGGQVEKLWQAEGWKGICAAHRCASSCMWRPHRQVECGANKEEEGCDTVSVLPRFPLIDLVSCFWDNRFDRREDGNKWVFVSVCSQCFCSEAVRLPSTKHVPSCLYADTVLALFTWHVRFFSLLCIMYNCKHPQTQRWCITTTAMAPHYCCDCLSHWDHSAVTLSVQKTKKVTLNSYTLLIRTNKTEFMTLSQSWFKSLRPHQSHFTLCIQSCVHKHKNESKCWTLVCDSHLMLFTAQGDHMKTDLLGSFGQHCALRPLPRRVKHQMCVSLCKCSQTTTDHSKSNVTLFVHEAIT